MHDKIGVGTWSCSPRERELINEVLDSGRLSYGPKSKELERRFAAIHHARYGVLSNSGTSSLQVALQAMKEIHGWKDGDMVAIPAVTFVATANVVLHNRMIPVLVDVDPATYNMDMGMLEWELRRCPDIRAVIPVHLFGQPADMDGLDIVAEDQLIIEDSCECMFAEHNGRSVGSMGDIGCFSFYVAHLLTTGVGGISITDNPDYAAKMRSLVNHGRDGIYISVGDDDTEDRDKLIEIVNRRFHFESVGHSYRITELESALGLAQLESFGSMIIQRQINAEYLTKLLKPLHRQSILQLPHVASGNTHSWMMYPIVLVDEDKSGLVAHLELHGIETREMLPLTNQPVYKGMWDAEDYPVASWINRSGFYVGCHQDLDATDIERIAYTIEVYFEKTRKVSHHSRTASD